jgi:NAD(P)-dependent dehydrogenase (short-subunit alcohol dehydrogenase family)
VKGLQGRSAIVTGAGSGIGRGIALALAKRGVNVLVADIDEHGGQAAAAELRNHGVEADFAFCDVLSPGSYEYLRERITKQFSRCDIVVNNAAAMISGRPEAIGPGEWERVLNTNVMSVVRSQATFLPDFMAHGEGHIVNVASTAGLFAYAFDRLPYSASKAAVVSISEGLFMYLRPMGIGVTLVCPGPVRTNAAKRVKRVGPSISFVGLGSAFEFLDAQDVGEMTVDAIEHDRFLVLTHPEQTKAKMVRRAEEWEESLIATSEHIHGEGGTLGTPPD